MALSDISIEALDRIGRADAEHVTSLIRSIPDFPQPGILFRDFMPLLADARGLRLLLDAMERALPVPVADFDVVAGLEARGFLLGPALAVRLGKGFIAVRKAGKLPPDTVSKAYALEYAHAEVEVEVGAIGAGTRVLVVDDLLATGGTAKAAAQLIEACRGHVAGFGFVMELVGLEGRKSLHGYPCSTLMSMPA